jgi:hypothetical protein
MRQARTASSEAREAGSDTGDRPTRQPAAKTSGPSAFLRAHAPAAIAVTLSLLLAAAGYRLFVDATAAVVYNADERIPKAVHGAWAYAAIWGSANGAIAYLAYRRGLVRRGREVPWVAASALFILDGSFNALLGMRGNGGLGAVLGAALTLVVVGLLVYLAWRRPRIGGILLLVLGVVLGFGALLGSATYESEAHGLLFDEDLFYIFSIGLVPFFAGLLWLVSTSPRNRERDVGSVT